MKEQRGTRYRKNPEQKLNVLYVMLTLLWHSYETHPLTIDQIREAIVTDFGAVVLRKAIVDAIAALGIADRKCQEDGHAFFAISEDHSLDQRKTRYYHISKRLFSEAELRYLIDAVYTSPAITGEHAESLIKKLTATCSERERATYQAIHKSFEGFPKLAPVLFYNIQQLQKAIASHQQIRFCYGAYDLAGNLVSKKNPDGTPKKYTYAPYYLTMAQGNYYLIALSLNHPESPTFFRVDFLSRIDILEGEENACPPEGKIACFAHFDIDAYMKDRLYALKGSPTYCTVRVDDPKAVSYLYDRFGKNAKLYQENGVTYGKVYCAPNAFYFWVMAYADELTVLGPEELVNWMKATAKKILCDNH